MKTVAQRKTPSNQAQNIFVLFDVNQSGNSNDLFRELDYMLCGLYSTRKKAEISFANLITEREPELETIIFPDALPTVTDELLQRYGFKIMCAQIDD